MHHPGERVTLPSPQMGVLSAPATPLEWQPPRADCKDESDRQHFCPHFDVAVTGFTSPLRGGCSQARLCRVCAHCTGRAWHARVCVTPAPAGTDVVTPTWMTTAAGALCVCLFPSSTARLARFSASTLPATVTLQKEWHKSTHARTHPPAPCPAHPLPLDRDPTAGGRDALNGRGARSPPLSPPRRAPSRRHGVAIQRRKARTGVVPTQEEHCSPWGLRDVWS